METPTESARVLMVDITTPKGTFRHAYQVDPDACFQGGEWKPAPVTDAHPLSAVAFVCHMIAEADAMHDEEPVDGIGLVSWSVLNPEVLDPDFSSGGAAAPPVAVPPVQGREDFTTPQWRQAFPDFDEADIVDLGAGWMDVSWKNEACPCFQEELSPLSVFMDYRDPAARENPELPRFAVLLRPDDDNPVDLFSTEDEAALRAFLAGYVAARPPVGEPPAAEPDSGPARWVVTVLQHHTYHVEVEAATYLDAIDHVNRTFNSADAEPVGVWYESTEVEPATPRKGA